MSIFVNIFLEFGIYLEIVSWKLEIYIMYLFINTTNYEYIFLALINKKGDIIIQKNIKAKYQQSEKLLENIDKILNNPVKSLRDHGVDEMRQ